MGDYILVILVAISLYEIFVSYGERLVIAFFTNNYCILTGCKYSLCSKL